MHALPLPQPVAAPAACCVLADVRGCGHQILSEVAQLCMKLVIPSARKDAPKAVLQTEEAARRQLISGQIVPRLVNILQEHASYGHHVRPPDPSTVPHPVIGARRHVAAAGGGVCEVPLVRAAEEQGQRRHVCGQGRPGHEGR
jgi:hypothetical protein